MDVSSSCSHKVKIHFKVKSTMKAKSRLREYNHQTDIWKILGSSDLTFSMMPYGESPEVSTSNYTVKKYSEL